MQATNHLHGLLKMWHLLLGGVHRQVDQSGAADPAGGSGLLLPASRPTSSRTAQHIAPLHGERRHSSWITATLAGGMAKESVIKPT